MTAKQQVQLIRPNAKMFESQIQFQTTYNIKDGNEFLGMGYTVKAAWEKALKNLSAS